MLSNFSINSQESFIEFLKSNLEGQNLSTRGLARLCGLSDHKTLVAGGRFVSKKLASVLTEQGYQAEECTSSGFDAKASWLVIEYYAYDSKAKALGAKQIARTFGMIGVISAFDALSGDRSPDVPKTFADALRLAADQQEELERQKRELALKQAEVELLEEDSERQAEIIDELFDYSSIIRIAKYNGVSETLYKWRQLRLASRVVKAEIKKAPCPRFGSKNLYSHEAWRMAYPGAKLPETTTLVVRSQNQN
jgi:hypothetical protein